MASATPARPKPAEAGRTFLTGVFAKLPEEQRGQVMAVLESAEAAEALALAGTGVLAQQEFSRKMDSLSEREKALAGWRDELATWKAGKEGDFKHYEALTARATELGYGSAQEMVEDLGEGASRRNVEQKPLKLPDNLVTSEVLAQAMQTLEQQALPVMVALNQLAIRHFRTFGEELDQMELINDPSVQKEGLRGVYDRIYGDRYLAKADEKKKADDKVLRESIRTEERAALVKEMGGHRMPYPTGRRDPAAIDVIDPSMPRDPAVKSDPTQFSVEAAVTHYETLGQQREQHGA